MLSWGQSSGDRSEAHYSPCGCWHDAVWLPRSAIGIKIECQMSHIIVFGLYSECILSSMYFDDNNEWIVLLGKLKRLQLLSDTVLNVVLLGNGWLVGQRLETKSKVCPIFVLQYQKYKVSPIPVQQNGDTYPVSVKWLSRSCPIEDLDRQTQYKVWPILCTVWSYQLLEIPLLVLGNTVTRESYDKLN